VDVWVDGVGARKEKERERDGETEREMGRECGRGTRRWASRLSPPFPSLSLSLSLSAQKTDTGGSRLFHSPFSFTYCPPGRGTSLGGRCWLAAVKMESKKKEKRGGEKESEREPVPKTG
jgi:hypothetical protein